MSKNRVAPKKKAAPSKRRTIDRREEYIKLLEKDWFNLDITRSEKKKPIKLDLNIVEAIRKYLENPTKSGLWHLQAKWESESGISEYVRKELDKKLEGRDELEIPSGIRLKLTKDKRSEFYTEVNSKISFITSLFTHLIHLEGQTTEIPRYSDINQLIFELINVRKLKSAYGDAYQFFKTNLYLDGFKPIVPKEELFQIKDGAFISREVPAETGRVFLTGTSPVPLETFAQFLKSLGKISDYSLSPVFSPEEVVFEPYFVLLKVSFPYIIGDQHALGLFERAFNEYSEGHHTNCVSTIGLIAEDYLTQIYETLFRDVCPKGLTLGQIYDLIHSSILKLFQPEPKKVSDITPLYNEIKKQLVDSESNPTSSHNKEILILLRNVLGIIKEDREYFQDRVSNLNKKSEVLSAFPKYLRDNLNELIRYRNAASHKTRIPIGPYEALRTVYCLISLYLWWDAEKKIIDWKEDSVTILKKVIERNAKPITK